MHNKLGFILVAAISMLIDWYVFQGVKTLITGLQSLRLRQIINWSYWMFSVGLTVSLLYIFYSILATGKITTFTNIAFNTFLTLFVTKLVFIIVLFGEDIYRIVATAFNFFNSSHTKTISGEPLMPDRRKFISQVGLLIASIPFTSFIYGIVKGKYDFKLHKHTLYFDDLPENFDGFTITQISDIHAGSFDNEEAVQSGIDLANKQNSDLFVFTGDLVNNEAEEIVPWLNHFKQLKAPYGQFSILGNHDYGEYFPWKNEDEKNNNLNALKKYHTSLGYHLLLNENVTIEKGGQKITLLGVENWGGGLGVDTAGSGAYQSLSKGDLDKALAGTENESFKILLSHDPTHWEKKVKNHPTKIHLTLSGHTHGMQMGIEIPGFKWSPVKYRYPNWAGLAKENERFLYVNRGFGFLGFSGRVGIWPEITVITLKKA